MKGSLVAYVYYLRKGYMNSVYFIQSENMYCATQKFINWIGFDPIKCQHMNGNVYANVEFYDLHSFLNWKTW